MFKDILNPEMGEITTAELRLATCCWGAAHVHCLRRSQILEGDGVKNPVQCFFGFYPHVAGRADVSSGADLGVINAVDKGS